MSGAGGPAKIEVGATHDEGTLRLWLAQQAVINGETALTAQLGAVSRLNTSATAVLGWSVTISLALIAVLSQAWSPTVLASGTSAAAGLFLAHLAWPIGAALATVLGASVACVVVMWPAYWRPPGYAPDLILTDPYPTELEVLEAMAAGYTDALTHNSRNLTRLEKWLRSAWLLFAATPFFGLATYAAEPLIPDIIAAARAWLAH